MPCSGLPPFQDNTHRLLINSRVDKNDKVRIEKELSVTVIKEMIKAKC